MCQRHRKQGDFLSSVAFADWKKTHGPHLVRIQSSKRAYSRLDPQEGDRSIRFLLERISVVQDRSSPLRATDAQDGQWDRLTDWLRGGFNLTLIKIPSKPSKAPCSVLVSSAVADLGLRLCLHGEIRTSQSGTEDRVPQAYGCLKRKFFPRNNLKRGLQDEGVGPPVGIRMFPPRLAQAFGACGGMHRFPSCCHIA